jgi:hypothetical protein
MLTQVEHRSGAVVGAIGMALHGAWTLGVLYDATVGQSPGCDQASE